MSVLQKQFDPLEDGISLVEYVDHMGNDASIVRSARVSYGKDKTPFDVEKDSKLIRYLLSNNHGTPFESNSITLNVTLPIYIARQWIRHRVGVCLSGNTRVTFVNTNNEGIFKLSKTMAELYQLWNQGEKHPITVDNIKLAQAKLLLEQGLSTREVSKQTGLARNTIRKNLNNSNIGFRDSKKRIQNMKLRVLNEDTGYFEIGHIKEVFCNGLRRLFRLTLADGKTLDCSGEHQLFTSEGWQRLKDAVGLSLSDNGSLQGMTKECYLMCNGLIVGQGEYQNKEWLEEYLNKGLSTKEIAQIANTSIETIKKWVYKHQLVLNKKLGMLGKTPWNKGKFGYSLNITEESNRNRISKLKKSVKRGKESNFWKGGITSERAKIGAWTNSVSSEVHKKFNFICQYCQETGKQLNAHHLVPVFADISLAYNFNNLVSLCDDCHTLIHSQNIELEFAKSFSPTLTNDKWKKKPTPLSKKLKAHPVKVIKIKDLGEQTTYDIEVEGQWHNFVANGIVVHNSFNEISLRYTEATDKFYVPKQLYHQDNKNRQGSAEPLEMEENNFAKSIIEVSSKRAFNNYQELLKFGVSKEHARMVLPVNLYTRWYFTFNLRSIMHWYSLRADLHAQLEIRKYADSISEIMKALFPIAWNIFLERFKKNA